MKVEEQVTLLKSKKTGIAVGTPARLMDLIDNGNSFPLFNLSHDGTGPDLLSGALSLTSLQRLIVDASHIDQKKRGVMDMKDTAMPLARFLARQEFKDRYTDDKKPVALLFY